MMSAIATMIDSNDQEEINKIMDTIDDPAGTFYRFSLPVHSQEEVDEGRCSRSLIILKINYFNYEKSNYN